MKFKKISRKLGIFKLGCRIAEDTIKYIYYEVWDDGIHYGNICGGGVDIGLGLKTKEWEFVPACGDTGGGDRDGLNIKQLRLIVKKIDELNEKVQKA